MSEKTLYLANISAAFYIFYDKQKAYVHIRDPTDREPLTGITYPMRHFCKAYKRLGINVIYRKQPRPKAM
jgi:hypothetical protein